MDRSFVSVGDDDGALIKVGDAFKSGDVDVHSTRREGRSDEDELEGAQTDAVGGVQ
jgi:hypothetical protein